MKSQMCGNGRLWNLLQTEELTPLWINNKKSKCNFKREKQIKTELKLRKDFVFGFQTLDRTQKEE